MAKRSLTPFAKLLVKISGDLVSADLTTMKEMLIIGEILPAGKLEDSTSGLEIFRQLKESSNLSEDNVDLLKELLESMGKLELLNTVEEYERSNLQKTIPRMSDATAQEAEYLYTRTLGHLSQTHNQAFPGHRQPPSSLSRPDSYTATSFGSDITFVKERTTSNQSDELCSNRNESIRLREESAHSPGSNVRVCEERLYQAVDTDCPPTLPKPQSIILLDKKIPTTTAATGVTTVATIGATTVGDFELLEDDIVYLRNETSRQSSGAKFSDQMIIACLPSGESSKQVQLRGYQLELAQPSLDGLNSIICAPTGSGKTLTAGYIFQERWKLATEKGKDFRGLFIVCQRTLVLQQRKALEDFFPLDSGISVGAVEENQLLKELLLLPLHLIVLTAQKLVNCLETSSVKVENFEILILDECHHTDLNHPYNKIMRFYHRLRRDNPNQSRPMIVGLTASLGVGSGKQENAAQLHYINICANLNCSCITHVREANTEQELLRFSPKPTENQIKSVLPRSPDNPFYRVMTQFMGNIEKETGLVFSKPHERGTQTYENWIVSHWKDALQRDDLPHVIVACEVLNDLNLAWILHDQLRIKDAKEFLDSRFPPNWLPLNPIPMQSRIIDWYMNASKLLKDLVENETIEQCPQLHELCKLLRHLHRNHSDPRGILLTRTRLNADRLISFLEEQDEFRDIIFPAKFVGQGSSGSDDAMTQTEQENTLRRFRLGSEDPARVNLLVATDVAQEGLDMPKCNYVIRYNFVSNEIGSVQSRGRARAPNSELYLIVTRGSVNETRELENMQKEHQMQQALKKMDDIDRQQLEKAITDLQDKNWQDHEDQLARDQARSSSIDHNSVTIHCSKCKDLLCNASDLRIRGSNYICVADDFEDRVIFREISKKKEFASEIHLGQIFCKSLTCPGNKLGLKIKYKQGCRIHGLVLGKDGCVWKQTNKAEFMIIRQWSKVPFTISKENI